MCLIKYTKSIEIFNVQHSNNFWLRCHFLQFPMEIAQTIIERKKDLFNNPNIKELNNLICDQTKGFDEISSKQIRFFFHSCLLALRPDLYKNYCEDHEMVSYILDLYKDVGKKTNEVKEKYEQVFSEDFRNILTNLPTYKKDELKWILTLISFSPSYFQLYEEIKKGNLPKEILNYIPMFGEAFGTKNPSNQKLV